MSRFDNTLDGADIKRNLLDDIIWLTSDMLPSLYGSQIDYVSMLVQIVPENYFESVHFDTLLADLYYNEIVEMWLLAREWVYNKQLFEQTVATLHNPTFNLRK